MKHFKHNNPTNKVSVSLTKDNLFKIRDYSQPLLENKARIFHEFTAKGPYLSEWARQYTSTAIGFLFQRVKNMDEEDWKKLVHYVG